jgi:hypothetical protein
MYIFHYNKYILLYLGLGIHLENIHVLFFIFLNNNANMFLFFPRIILKSKNKLLNIETNKNHVFAIWDLAGTVSSS